MVSPKPGPGKERLMVYIDGFNLYHAMHEAFEHKTLWLDLVQLAQSFRPSQTLVGVRYFTAPVLGDPDAQSRQAHYVDALRARYPNVLRVVQGRYQRKDFKCYDCGSVHVRYEEKETDVNIAVSLLTDAALHNMDTAILVSGDSDMVPAVTAAMKIHPPLFIAAAFPPQRVSKHLRALMPSSFSIAQKGLRRFQLPDSFDIGGKTYTRPAKWV